MKPRILSELEQAMHDPIIPPETQTETQMKESQEIEDQVQSHLTYIIDSPHAPILAEDNQLERPIPATEYQVIEDKQTILDIFKANTDSIKIATALASTRLGESEHNKQKGFHQPIGDVLVSMVNDEDPRVDQLFDRIFDKTNPRLYYWLLDNKSMEKVVKVIEAYNKMKKGSGGISVNTINKLTERFNKI